uniref:ACT domain-containing protein n=1 Tax=Candidatus Methanophagaceae archaeon ANME-1 ERB6 TaxID=2759912 RepID=A0A7G9YS11_9EURY|nr:hypothetical protein HMJGLFMP_00037 [Methanosarcinales archaeon ANME-1 ERB6]
MICSSVDIELTDVPGQLVLALKPVSDLGGNILSVLHQRDKKTPSGRIPVQLTLEIESLSMPGVDKKSSASVTLSAIGKEELKEALGILERTVNKKGHHGYLLYLRLSTFLVFAIAYGGFDVYPISLLNVKLP